MADLGSIALWDEDVDYNKLVTSINIQAETRLVEIPSISRDVTGTISGTIGNGSVASSYRYWRLLISANNGDMDYTSLGSLDIKNDSSNLSAGMTCTASSNNSGDGPANALDTNSGTEWVTSGGSAFPHWIAVDLGSAKEVTKYDIQAQRVNGDTRTPKDWKLQANNTSLSSGAPWVDIMSVSNETGWTEYMTRTYNVPASYIPAPNVRVALMYRSNMMPVAFAITDAVGHYEFKGLDKTDLKSFMVIAIDPKEQPEYNFTIARDHLTAG